jgi:hypothetical protein
LERDCPMNAQDFKKRMMHKSCSYLLHHPAPP